MFKILHRPTLCQDRITYSLFYRNGQFLTATTLVYCLLQLPDRPVWDVREADNNAPVHRHGGDGEGRVDDEDRL